MEIGKRIRQLRINKGLTQEALANSLGVSYQAVSRWENSVTQPDISLLPAIAVFFGVTIDELFELTADSRFDRIQTMLSDKDNISDNEFSSSKDFLEAQLHGNKENVRAVKLLAWLYEHKAKSLSAAACEYAKQALNMGDTSKSMNNILRDSNGVPHADWNCRNAHELIDFYYEHLKQHPDDLTACRYLINTLVFDGRTAEAEEILKKIEGKEEENRINICKVKILYKNGENEKAEELLNQMLKKSPNDWYIANSAADIFAEQGEYDKAIELYERAFALQSNPKYIDSLEAIMHIFEIKKDYKKAAETAKRILAALESEWNVTFGASVDKYNAEIQRLNSK